MGHNRDGTLSGFTRIRGKTRGDPRRRRRKPKNVISMLIFNLLTARMWLEWREYMFFEKLCGPQRKTLRSLRLNFLNRKEGKGKWQLPKDNWRQVMTHYHSLIHSYTDIYEFKFNANRLI